MTNNTSVTNLHVLKKIQKFNDESFGSQAFILRLLVLGFKTLSYSVPRWMYFNTKVYFNNLCQKLFFQVHIRGFGCLSPLKDKLETSYKHPDIFSLNTSK